MVLLTAERARCFHCTMMSLCRYVDPLAQTRTSTLHGARSGSPQYSSPFLSLFIETYKSAICHVQTTPSHGPHLKALPASVQDREMEPAFGRRSKIVIAMPENEDVTSLDIFKRLRPRLPQLWMMTVGQFSQHTKLWKEEENTAVSTLPFAAAGSCCCSKGIP